MTDRLVPYKECKIGFAIQTGKGAAAASPTAYYPLPEGGGINPLKNYSFFHWADNNYAVAHYMSEGEWNEGTILVPIIPGYTLDDTDADVLYRWIFDREAAAYYYESKWATIWRCLGHVYEKFPDCKCTSGVIRNAGGTFMALEMNVTGIAAPSEPGSCPAGDVITTDPYTFDHATLSLKLTGGAYAADAYETDLPINFDNHNVSPADMITLQPSRYPLDLPCTEKTEVGGTMNRLFMNSLVYDDFKAGTEGAIKIAMTTGGLTATIEMPRTIYTEDPIGIPTEDLLKEDAVGWQALGSVAGDVDAIVITESA